MTHRCNNCRKPLEIQRGTLVKTDDGITGVVEQFWAESQELAFLKQQGKGAHYNHLDKILVSYDKGQMRSGHGWVYRYDLTHVECSR